MTDETRLTRCLFVSTVAMYSIMMHAGDDKELINQLEKVPGFASAARTIMHLYPDASDLLKALDAFSTSNGYDKVSKNG